MGQLDSSSAVRRLLLVFIGWKLILLMVASASPGPGYDTSTYLLLPQTTKDDHIAYKILIHVLTRLVRWDGFYFVSVATSGYRHEQEWAFGWGFTTLLNYCGKGIVQQDCRHSITTC
jgi:phosphatidylinositol glycan class V